MKLFKITICDHCGRWWPPVVEGRRTTTCCASDKGLYLIPDSPLFSVGKTQTVWIRLRSLFLKGGIVMQSRKLEHTKTCQGDCLYCKHLHKAKQEKEANKALLAWDEPNVLL